MSRFTAFPQTRSIWRRAKASLAIAASLTLAFEPYLAMAQSADLGAVPQIQVKSKSPAKAVAKKVQHHTATDMVSDDLNRREAERVTKLVHDMTASPTQAAASPANAAPAMAAAPVPAATAIAPTPAVATKAIGSEPPTVMAIPARAPIVTASLTPEVASGPASSRAPTAKISDQSPQTVPAPAQLALPKLPAAKPSYRLTQNQTQIQAQTQAPVPIQPAPPNATSARPAQIVSGAPSRAFGQGQIVPTQQPTLTLEVNKGTAIKLSGPAATVFVAAPDIADVQVKSPGMIYVFAKKPGDTVLYAVDDQDRVLLNTIVSVTSPISRMKAMLDSIHPGNGVTFDNQGETIVLAGTVRSALIAEDARRLALQNVNGNALKVISNIRIDAPTQVQLRVKVAEVQRDALKRVGINWQNINNIALFGLGPFQAGAAVSTVQATGGAASGGISLASNNGSLTSFIDFLATQNQATILAEPNLIAMSGETASFLAGGEIPLIVPQAGLAAGTIAVAYKQVGVSLSFTPTIIGDRIHLKVSPEVSQLTSAGSVSIPLTPTAVVTVPAIQTRKASTTIELGSGQSFAIAGLLQHTSQQDVTKLPWLGDVPVLGTLFKSDAFQRSETELVIIITPYFVEPVNGTLRTPLTDRVPPTDADRLVYQRLNNPTPPRRLTVGQQTGGPTAGFKLD